MFRPDPNQALQVKNPDIAIEDWDDLMCAVKTRLRRIADETSAAMPERQGQDLVGRIRASVLECVEALDQLHTAQQHETSRRQRLKLNLFDERAGTRAPETNSLSHF
ncbi:MAG: hypothetical protein ABI606_15430 [Rhodoferax sp.]